MPITTRRSSHEDLSSLASPRQSAGQSPLRERRPSAKVRDSGPVSLADGPGDPASAPLDAADASSSDELGDSRLPGSRDRRD